MRVDMCVDMCLNRHVCRHVCRHVSETDMQRHARATGAASDEGVAEKQEKRCSTLALARDIIDPSILA